MGRLTRIFSWSCNLGQCLPKIFLEFERKTGNSKEMKGISCIFMYFLFLDDPSKLAQTIFSKCGITLNE